MTTSDDEIDFIHCQNGALRVESADGCFTLSQQQLKILMCVCSDSPTNNDGCKRRDLHAAALGHCTLPRGRVGRGCKRDAAAKLSAAQRAALSRSLRRLAELGLVARSRVRVAPTAFGTAIMACLRSRLVWKSWCGHWLRADDPPAMSADTSENKPAVRPRRK